jgi:hypothetical protein
VSIITFRKRCIVVRSIVECHHINSLCELSQEDDDYLLHRRQRGGCMMTVYRMLIRCLPVQCSHFLLHHLSFDLDSTLNCSWYRANSNWREIGYLSAESIFFNNRILCCLRDKKRGDDEQARCVMPYCVP